MSDDPVGDIPPYDFEGIERFSEGIDASEEDWERFFALAGVEPLRIVYEDFVAAYDETVGTAAEYVGIDPGDLTVSPPTTAPPIQRAVSGVCPPIPEGADRVGTP